MSIFKIEIIQLKTILLFGVFTTIFQISFRFILRDIINIVINNKKI